jgi:hypothetical protein
LAGKVDIQCGDRLSRVNSRANGAQCVVLVDSWDAEYRHQPLPGNPLCVTAVPLERARNLREYMWHDSAECLWVELLSETDQIGDNHRNGFPDFRGRRRRWCIDRFVGLRRT